MASSETVDQSLADDLERLDYYAAGDAVEILVQSIERADDERTAIVTFDPPLGEAFEREMDVPVDPSVETEFTKLLRTTGHAYQNVAEVAGERVPAQYTDDGWTIQYDDPPEPEPTRRERIRSGTEVALAAAAVVGGLIYWPIAGLVVSGAIFLEGRRDDEYDAPLSMELFFAALAYAAPLAVWFAVSSVVRAVAAALGIQFPVEVVVSP